MTRTVDFIYRVVRDGADFCELAATGAPRVSMESTNSVPTRFSGSFLFPEAGVDWLTDEIRPVLVVDGEEHSLGLFAAVSVTETEANSTRILRIEAFDRCWRVRDHRIERVLYFPAGTQYLSAVGSLLAECGIGVISAVPSSEVLAEDRADWEIGTSVLEIVNGLLAEINYLPLAFDGAGTALLRPRPGATAENITHSLDSTNIEDLTLPGISRSSDFHSTPNVFICMCSNPDKDAPMVSVAENTNPQSPLSIARRGRRITQLITVDNIASQEELDTYAARMVTDTMLTGEQISVQSCLLPGFGVYDVIGLRYRAKWDYYGVEGPEDAGPEETEIFAVCIEKAWSMELKAGGRMSHTLERVVMNLD